MEGLPDTRSFGGLSIKMMMYGLACVAQGTNKDVYIVASSTLHSLLDNPPPPLCERCIQTRQMSLWSTVLWSRPLLLAYTSEQSADRIKEWQQSWDIAPASDTVCRACGCGDNTIGHWTRWCPVPLIVALSILRPSRQVDNLGQLARMGVKYAVTCTLVIASFRRLLRQEGAFLHQQAAEPKDVLWWITTLYEMVATDSHIELGIEFPKRTWAMGCCSLSAQKVSVRKIMPLDYTSPGGGCLRCASWPT